MPIEPRTRSVCARTSRSCSAPWSSRFTSHGTSCGPARSNRRPAGSPSSYRSPSCTWPHPCSCRGRARRGPTFREVLLVHAVGRIAYRGWIDNVQVSWVKTGIRGARQVLRAGANDLGGTLMDENISRAAGASHGQELDDESFSRDRRSPRPAARATNDALRPHPDRRSPAQADRRHRRAGHPPPDRQRGMTGSR